MTTTNLGSMTVSVVLAGTLLRSGIVPLRDVAGLGGGLPFAAAALGPTVGAQNAVQPASPKRLMGFSVVLVQGDMSGTNATSGLPGSAARALADLKEFLPYKSYQLLDAQWTMGQGRMISRLQGAGTAYRVELDTAWTSPSGGRMMVRPPASTSESRVTVERLVSRPVLVRSFVLREIPVQTAFGPDTAAGRVDQERLRQREEQHLEQLRSAAERKVAEIRSRIAKGLLTSSAAQPLLAAAQHEVEVVAKDAELLGLRENSSTIIDSSFQMELGETVVVGTSKIAGDKALIVLLTAVAK